MSEHEQYELGQLLAHNVVGDFNITTEVCTAKDEDNNGELIEYLAPFTDVKHKGKTLWGPCHIYGDDGLETHNKAIRAAGFGVKNITSADDLEKDKSGRHKLEGFVVVADTAGFVLLEDSLAGDGFLILNSGYMMATFSDQGFFTGKGFGV